MDKKINERAKSVAQRNFFGMVDAYKKGEMPNAGPAIKKAADGMSMKQVKDFAKTKHKGLPERISEAVDREIGRKIREALLANALSKTNINESINEISNDTADWAYKEAMRRSGILDFGSPQRVKNDILMKSLKKHRNDKLGFDPDAVGKQIRQSGTSGNEKIDRKWATWEQNRLDRKNGKRTYDEKTGRWTTHLTENDLRKIIQETVQTHLVDVLGKYTQGKTSSKEANKAIMDLANSSNTNLNESFKSRIIKNFADKYGIGYADPALSEITDDMIFNSDIVTEYPGWAVKDPKNYLVYKGKNDVWLILGVNQNFKDNFDYDYFDWGSRKPYPKDKSDELKRRRTKWDGQQGVKRDDGKYNYVYHSKMNNNHFLKNYTNKDFSNDMYWKKELG